MANVPRLDSVSQSIAISGFTNDGMQFGHIDLTDKIPAGSFVTGWKASITTRFTGSAGGRGMLAVGTPASAAAFSHAGEHMTEGVSAELGDVTLPEQAYRPLETVVRVTVTDLFDFDNVTGGAVAITVFFMRTVI